MAYYLIIIYSHILIDYQTRISVSSNHYYNMNKWRAPKSARFTLNPVGLLNKQKVEGYLPSLVTDN